MHLSPQRWPIRLLVLAFAAIAGLFVMSAPAAGADLRVMSFNIRTANAADGVNDWDGDRKDLVEQTIRNFVPDLVGMQESLKRQHDFLADKFPGFEVVGRGSQGGNNGTYNSLMYARNRFDKLARAFCLSDTPNVPGSKSWDTAFPAGSHAQLRDKQEPRHVRHYEHALDHVTPRPEGSPPAEAEKIESCADPGS